ncbi:MAG: hypothetical protein QM781_20900 [Chitinophagaceae bacterium]
MRKPGFYFLLCSLLLNSYAGYAHLTKDTIQSEGRFPFTVKFDIENARSTLALLGSKQVSEKELDNWLASPGTRALIRKLNSTPAIARSAMIKAIENKKEDADENKYQYAHIRQQLNSMQLFLNRLTLSADSITRAICEELRPFRSSGNDTVILYGLMGGYSAGFAFTNNKSAFYMGLHFYKGDITGVAVSAKHELFHTIQSAEYRFEPVMENLRQTDSAWEAPYYLLRHLFLEGSAEFVADNEPYLKTSPYLRREHEHGIVNTYRHEAVFYLIEHLLLDAFYKPSLMDFGQLYSILFDWNWNNPAYYAGKHMMAVLVKEYGPGYLEKSLRRDALYFIRDYMQLANSGRIAGAYNFSAGFQQLVDAMLHQVEKHQPAAGTVTH